MDTEKIINSRWFISLEWLYRLLMLNLFTIVILLVVGGGPFLIWYYNQELGFLMIISAILTIFTFIPCFITILIMIKLYMESKVENFFKDYFYYLIDTFKRIYILIFILLILIVVFYVGISFYWELLAHVSEINLISILAILGFVVIFFLVISTVFAFVQLPMIMAYFRMKLWTIVKFSYFLAYKYFFKTLIYIGYIIISLLVFELDMLWVLFILYGFSGPLFFIFLSSRALFLYLSNNIEDIKNEDIL